MDSVKRVSGKKVEHHPSTAQHKILQKSTTLNRKFVKRPTAKPQMTKQQMAERQQLEREAFLRRKVMAERMDRENRMLIAKKRQGGVKLVPMTGSAVVGAVKKASDKEREEQPVVHPTVEVANARMAARKASRMAAECREGLVGDPADDLVRGED